MIDPFKGCDRRDDDAWSIGSLFCWALIIVTGLAVTLAFCGATFQ